MQEACIARLAQTIFEQLRALVLRHTLVATDPCFREDPMHAAEGQIAAMDVSAISVTFLEGFACGACTRDRFFC